MVVSDPRLRSAHRPASTSWFAGMLHAPLVRRSAEAPPAPRPVAHRVFAYGVVAVGFCVALYSLATLLARPLVTASSTAPVWSVEVAASGRGPVTVLAYGREVGLHLVRVPSEGSGDRARVIPARLADAELHLISLGWSSLSVRTTGPSGSPVKALSAQSRAVTIFQTPELTGVRTGW